MICDVGVVVPTFNRFNETVRAVESVKSQTLAPKRILVIDDGSEKEISEKLKNYMRDLEVEFLSVGPHRHPGIVRNYGISNLDTEWVAFLDSDDVWLPHKLEKQMMLAENSKCQAMCSNAFVNNVESNIEYFKETGPSEISLRKLLKSNQIINSSAVVKRKLLQEIGGIASSYMTRGSEDYASWLRVSVFENWKYDSEPLLVYFDNSLDSLRSSNEFEQKYIQYCGILDFQSWLESKSLTNKLLVASYLKFLPFLVNFSRKFI